MAAGGGGPWALGVGRAATLAAKAGVMCLGALVIALLADGASGGALLPVVEVLFWAFVAFLAVAGMGAVGVGYLRHPAERKAILLVGVVVAATLAAHLYIINVPSTSVCDSDNLKVNGCIGDETYYVAPAENMLKGKQCSVDYTDLTSDCNLEHPFLAKGFIAAGIAVFGDNTFGWRIFQVLLGTFSIPLMYLLAVKVSGSRRLGYVAALLLALDTMFFVHSSAGLIDVHMVFFSLLAFVAYFYRVRIWRFDRLFVAGALLGVAGLTKETAVFLALTLLTYHMLAGEVGEKASAGGWFAALRRRVVPTGKIAVSGLVVFAVGLQAFDSLYAAGAFPLFTEHVSYMLSYGASLVGTGYVYGPGHVEITPLSWLTYYWPTPYYEDIVRFCPNPAPGANLCVFVSYVEVGYYSLSNMFDLWPAFLWVPLVGVGVWRGLRPRTLSPEGEDPATVSGGYAVADVRVSLLALVWFCWNYFPYVVLYLAGRTTYPFYILPAMPAVALGAGFLLTRWKVPWRLALAYLAAVFAFFVWYFPYKGFLPEWLKIIIHSL
ncbi:MAG: glycosyltransferase family 39 protein [Thaumarchaeota archaeon]|nr:glycosyltransferase family 39 protein [Nitrososphaerota archaeon]